MAAAPRAAETATTGDATASTAATPPPPGSEASPLATPVAVTGAGRNVREGTETRLPLPRFVSLKAERVNVRRGPSSEHQIAWVFTKKGLPVEIVAEFEQWRRIRDSEGSRLGVLQHADRQAHRHGGTLEEEPRPAARGGRAQCSHRGAGPTGRHRRHRLVHRQLVRELTLAVTRAISINRCCGGSTPASRSATEYNLLRAVCRLTYNKLYSSGSRDNLTMTSTRLISACRPAPPAGPPP